MSEPQTYEELQQTTFFKAGREAKKNRIPLTRSALTHLRFGCWQYDAFIAGYDHKETKKSDH